MRKGKALAFPLMLAAVFLLARAGMAPGAEGAALLQGARPMMRAVVAASRPWMRAAAGQPMSMPAPSSSLMRK